MPHIPRLAAIILAFVIAFATDPLAADAPATVVWFSIDGVRSDYLDRADTPHLDRLIDQGLSTRELAPAFPSLTFSAHVSQATGATVAEHGVPSNVFYDRRRERLYAYPPWAWLMQAEPIWKTASRQGVRAAVIDWPLSHDQQSEHRAAYFNERFERGRRDRDRLDDALETWADDADMRGPDDPPLRLIMGYLIGPDTAGHRHGPDSDEVVREMEIVDVLVGRLVDRAIELHEAEHAADDRRPAADVPPLWIILTTDHGMAALHTLVHLGHLTEAEGDGRIRQVTGGNVGHLFIEIDDPVEREEALTAAEAAVAGHDFATAYRQNELPEAWGLAHPDRVGDLVVVLDSGYTFSRRAEGVATPTDEIDGPLGMHGYHPDAEPDMLGPAVFWRYPQSLEPREIGPIDALQLHPTVADLLGIAPADATDAAPAPLR